MKPATAEQLEVGRAARSIAARRSFNWFNRYMWPVMEPTRKMVPSVAMNGITAALQAVADKRIRRLGIACPPGVSKSIAGTVSFPAYLQLKYGGQARVMCGSYSASFAERDARRCRDLLISERYRELVNGEWMLRGDANKVEDFWTTAAGRRVTVSPGGRSMGERCTFQIVDDALSGSDSYSAAAKRDAMRWVNEFLPSRLENQDEDPRVVIGQRLAADDPMSSLIERGWHILSLPARLTEEDTPCVLIDDAGVEIWRDTRELGQPLLELLSASALDALLLDMGPAAFAAQYQQRPHDDSSSMFKRDWFARRWTVLPEKFDRVVITLDASFKAGKSSDFAVIQVWGALGADRYLIEQWRKRAGFFDTTNALREIRQRYPLAKVVIEEAANGHAIFDALKREMPGIVVVPPEGGKFARAATVEGICASGAVILPANAPWVVAWIDEVSTFSPASKNDDQVDAMVYALRELQVSSVIRRWEVMSR